MTAMPLLLMLLLAHMLGDFVLQRSSWIDERYEKHLYSARLYVHVTVHAVLALAVLWLLLPPSWQLPGAAVIIGATHFGIDLAKSYTPPGKLSWFLLDQFLHLLVIGLVWLWISDQWQLLYPAADMLLEARMLVIATAYVIVIWPFSIVIGLVCKSWTADLEGTESLVNAGKRIGQLERFLILTFILVDQFAAIGFLLAAKSILRFGDTREPNHRKINEYVLVGTLTSFSVTIAFGILARKLAEVL